MKKLTLFLVLFCCFAYATGNTVYDLKTSTVNTSVLGSTWTDGANDYTGVFDASVDYVVKGSKILYVAASRDTYQTANRFSGHALYIGDIASGSAGKVRILVDPANPDFAPRSVSFALMTVKSAAAADLLGGGALTLERGAALAGCRLVPTARAADEDGNVTIDIYAQRMCTMLHFR